MKIEKWENDRDGSIDLYQKYKNITVTSIYSKEKFLRLFTIIVMVLHCFRCFDNCSFRLPLSTQQSQLMLSMSLLQSADGTCYSDTALRVFLAFVDSSQIWPSSGTMRST